MPDNFKVIVVGGGPIGLCAAHALRLARIDFVVLERRSTLFKDEGAALVLGPETMRIMHQFGVFESLVAIGSDLDISMAFEKDGRRFGRNTQFREVGKNHGKAPTICHRAEVLETIYNGLPHDARTKILTGKKVVDITSDDKGVSVTCSDDTVYTGSIVIGADGVHSVTRHHMRDLALSEDPTREWDPEDPFEAKYSCVWGTVPLQTVAHTHTETHHQGLSTMYLPGNERSWVFLYEKLTENTRGRVRYTETDVLKQAIKFSDFHVMEDLTVADVFRPETAGMANIEEGIAKNWSWGRIVLAGDAAHKFAPNAGFGFLNGLQDIVELCNRLHAARKQRPDSALSVGTLAGLFSGYKEARKERLENDATLSWRILRFHTWANWTYYFFARWFLSWPSVPIFLANKMNAPRVAGGVVLDYVPVEEPLIGRVEWVHPMPKYSDLGGDSES